MNTYQVQKGPFKTYVFRMPCEVANMLTILAPDDTLLVDTDVVVCTNDISEAVDDLCALICGHRAELSEVVQ